MALAPLALDAWERAGAALAFCPPALILRGTCRESPVAPATRPLLVRCSTMWQKPEFEIVEVTMEVTAYVARR
jgi:coenzyme PQQ precursor peptide PqqA